MVYKKIIKAIHKNDIDIIKNIGPKNKLRKFLAESCKFGRLDIVKYIVSIMPDYDPEYDVPIIMAATHGHLNVIRYLLSLEQVLEDYGNKLIYAAAAYGHKHIVKYLLDGVYSDYLSAFDGSIDYGITGIVKYIMKNYDLEQSKLDNAIVNSCEKNYIGIVRHLLRYYTFNTNILSEALVTSIKKCNISITRLLLSYGVIIDRAAISSTLLTSIVHRGTLEAVKFVIENKLYIGESFDNLLEYAAGNKLEILKYLISLGANINSHGTVCLAYAVMNNRKDIIEYLLSMNVATNNNIAYWAVISNNVDLLRMLVNKGHNPMNEGDILYDIISCGKLEIAECLEGLLNDSHYKCMMDHAISTNSLRAIKCLVSRGIPISPYRDLFRKKHTYTIKKYFIRQGHWSPDLDPYKYFRLLGEDHLDKISNQEVARIIRRRVRKYDYPRDLIIICTDHIR